MGDEVVGSARKRQATKFSLPTRKPGEEGPRIVTHVWVHDDQLVALKLADGTSITTTEDHPFWNATDKQWQQSQQLGHGDSLHTSTGKRLPVNGIDWATAHQASAYNLTVDDIHTYYVLAGDTPVLVHNAGPCKPALGPAHLSDERWTHIKDGHFPGGKDVTLNEGIFIGGEDLVMNRIYDAIHRGRPMSNTDGRPGHTYTVDFGGYDVGYKIDRNGQRIPLQFYTVVVDEGRIVTAYPH